MVFAPDTFDMADVSFPVFLFYTTICRCFKNVLGYYKALNNEARKSLLLDVYQINQLFRHPKNSKGPKIFKMFSKNHS